MNNIKKKIGYAGIAVFVAFTCVISCADFAEHFQESEEVTGRLTLWELISQKPELSEFKELIEKLSYDRILSSDQSYTIWAPENEALAGINKNDTEAVLRLITNHIARYESPTSITEINNSILYMLSEKKLLFSKRGNSYFLGDTELAQKNLVAKNGILHTLKKQLPFEPSVWQYMEAAEFDSIRSYLYSFDKREFSRSASKAIDYNEEGMIVYDSVFLNQNILWYVYEGAKGIGWLNNEDSLYTMIVPNNEAWKEVYARTFDYFRPDPTVENPDSLQAANTRYSIVQDLVFRGAVNPYAYGVNDTLFSTRYAPIVNPSHIFTGLTSTQVSNGWVYPTSHLNYELHESSVKPIKVEAENVLGRWHNYTDDNGSIYSYKVLDIPDVSNNAYLWVNPSYSGASPSVSFELPDVLAAEYDIYCVCLAQSYVENISSNAPRYITRLRFELQQWDRVNRKEEQSSWVTISTWEDTTTPKYVTQPDGISKVLVAEKYMFPFANFKELDNVFRLKVASRLARTDAATIYKNEMRIDYILLEPSR